MTADSSITSTAVGTSNLTSHKYLETKFTSESNTHNEDKAYVGNLG